jgi:hypothetical protein
MTIFIAIDPALLAVPNHAASQDEAETIIHRISNWAKPALFKGMFRGVLLSDALEALTVGNYFPSGPNVAALLDMWNLRNVYSAEDIRRSINFILERALVAADCWGIEAGSPSFCETRPDLSAFKAEAPLYDVTVRLAVSALLAKNVNAHHFPVMVSGFPNFTGDIYIIATADDGFAKPEYELHFPISTRADLLLIGEALDIAVAIGPEKLWRSATDADQLHFAICAKVIQLFRARGASKRLREVPRFSIGSKFFRSISNFGGSGADLNCDVVLESCARLVMGNPKNKVAIFKRKTGAGRLVAARREGDNAEGLRTHLTKRHEALRLMFWRHTDGSLEFANIGPKAELEISDGVAQEAVSSDDLLLD